jgi:hypothetical protein
MKITRTSRLTGITRTLEINCTEVQLADWACGKLAQNAFPQLNADDREFIMTGITAEEWNAAFGGPELDDEDNEDEEQPNPTGWQSVEV